ncbi:MAG: signal peptidase I [Bacteroidales bacterium]|jgi:signal peptidase I
MNRENDTQTILEEISFSLLENGITIRAKADGYSMYPFIKPGSVILMEPVTPETTFLPGEIVAWKRDSGFVLHRLVRIINEGDEVLYVTRGDSCPEEDTPLIRARIAGKVLAIEDANGKIREGSQLISKPWYFYNRLKIWIMARAKRIARSISQ